MTLLSLLLLLGWHLHDGVVITQLGPLQRCKGVSTLGRGFLLYFVLYSVLRNFVEFVLTLLFWLAILFSSITLHILDKEWLGQYGGGYRIGAADNETRNSVK